jgi:hypothetical protein
VPEIRNIWLSRWASVARDPMPLRHALAFYLGIPLLLAALNGANHAGLAHSMSVSLGIVYWVGLCVPLWLAFDVMTRAVAIAMRPWAPPLWLVLCAGSLAGLAVVPPYVEWYVDSVSPALGSTTDGFQAVRLLEMRVSELDRVLGMAIWPMFWICVNYYYDRMLSIPRYRGRIMELSAPGGATGKPTPAPAEQAAQVPAGGEPIVSPSAEAADAALSDAGILRQVPPKLGKDIVALQAEDHYVRVYTLAGSALVRYRFKDAVEELRGLSGRRVHRSFWVRDQYVKGTRSLGDGLEIVMTTGLRVPVSRAYRSAVRSIAVDPAAAPIR